MCSHRRLLLFESSSLLTLFRRSDEEEYQKLHSYFETIAKAVPKTDGLGEVYIDLSGCGAINDENDVAPILSRRELWEGDAAPHPGLKGRLVIFDFARPLLAEVRTAFTRGAKTVLITGTPGVGKSTLRNVHTYFLLSDALGGGKRCCIIFAKGGEKKRKSVCLETDGTCRVEIMDESSPWMVPGFTPGTDLFILADISGGSADGMRGPGLVLYSSPNQNLVNRQIMKQDAQRLGYPILTKDQLCRYTNDRMNGVFERYGGLARLVWGNVMDEAAHKSRLIDSLQDVDGYLSILN